MDRVEAMRVLLAAVDAGSLSAASRALHVSLPSVSRKVAELERHLGTKLLVRTSRNVQLTDAGRDYVEAVRPILAQLEEAERRASGEYEEPRGELSITMPIEFGRRFVVPIALGFLEAHPEISLSIQPTDRIAQLVEERIDVGVRLGDLADSGLYAARVGEIRMLTCASPAYLAARGVPRHPRDLAGHDGIMFSSPSSFWWRYEDGEEAFEAAPRPRFRSSAASACVAAAAAGFGVARLFDYQVTEELRSGALLPVLDPFGSRPVPVHVVYARQGLLPLKVRAFVDWIVPRLRAGCRSFREPAG